MVVEQVGMICQLPLPVKLLLLHLEESLWGALTNISHGFGKITILRALQEICFTFFNRKGSKIINKSFSDLAKAPRAAPFRTVPNFIRRLAVVLVKNLAIAIWQP